WATTRRWLHFDTPRPPRGGRASHFDRVAGAPTQQRVIRTWPLLLDCPSPHPYKSAHRMRLYAGKISVIGTEVIKALLEAGDIAVNDKAEAELDVQAVLKEYLRLEREVTERAKDVLQKRNLPYEQFGKVKR